MTEFATFIKELRYATEHNDLNRIRALLQSEKRASPEINEFIREVLKTYCLRIRIFRESHLLAECELEANGHPYRIPDITVGQYSLESGTGQLLWEATLDESHLTWSKAFPSEPLPLAASSTDANQSYSLSTKLMNESLQLQVAPGLTQGEIILRNCRFVS